MLRRILVAVDDEYFAESIEEFLSNLDLNEAHVKVVHVVEPMEAFESWPGDQYRSDAEELLSRVASQLQEQFHDLQIEELLLEGYAADTIIEEAEAWNADLIVVGALGRRGLRRFLLGSVSSAIVAHAPCSVSIVRPQELKAKRAEERQFVFEDKHESLN